MSWHLVRGHDRVVESLRSSVRQGRLPHALLFAGPSGIGKRTFARKLAQALCARLAPKPISTRAEPRRMPSGGSGQPP